MKNFIFGITCLSVITLSNVLADDVLTGDTKLACEAILCLSSETRPAECGPSLAKYFAIHLKNPGKQLMQEKLF